MSRTVSRDDLPLKLVDASEDELDAISGDGASLGEPLVRDAGVSGRGDASRPYLWLALRGGVRLKIVKSSLLAGLQGEPMGSEKSCLAGVVFRFLSGE